MKFLNQIILLEYVHTIDFIEEECETINLNVEDVDVFFKDGLLLTMYMINNELRCLLFHSGGDLIYGGSDVWVNHWIDNVNQTKTSV